MKIKLIGLITAFVMVLSPMVALGQSSTDVTLETLQAQIQQLLAQVQVLQEQLSEARQETSDLRQELKSAVEEFRTQLRLGLTGEEVTLLQEILATDSDLYPEGLVTGYFGPLTRAAVLRFQSKFGIDQVGEVGPQTRKALNAFLKKDKGNSNKISANLFDKFESKKDIDDPDEDEHIRELKRLKAEKLEKVAICHKGKTITVASVAVNKHISNHGDTIGRCDGDDNDDDDDDNGDDTTAPVISNLGTSGVSQNSATVNWNTNENSTSRVLYGTTNPVNNSNGNYMNNGSLVSSHSLNLSGLTASTTYYLVVSSTDSLGNTSTSSQISFTTTGNVVDTTAPVISSVSSSGFGSTTATISWITDENATSRVVYGTTSPVTTTGTYSNNNSLVTNHSVGLSGLTASTTYFYLVSSADTLGNTATTTEGQFTTL